MDVTDKDDVSRVLAEFAAEHGGSFDLLLNNAGVAFLGDFETLTLEQHELVTGVNVNGVLNCTYLAFPYLLKAYAGQGHQHGFAVCRVRPSQ